MQLRSVYHDLSWTTSVFKCMVSDVITVVCQAAHTILDGIMSCSQMLLGAIGCFNVTVYFNHVFHQCILSRPSAQHNYMSHMFLSLVWNLCVLYVCCELYHNTGNYCSLVRMGSAYELSPLVAFRLIFAWLSPSSHICRKLLFGMRPCPMTIIFINFWYSLRWNKVVFSVNENMFGIVSKARFRVIYANVLYCR